MGRPSKPEYRKKTMRFSRVEDSFKLVLDKLSENDRKIILNVLEELKA